MGVRAALRAAYRRTLWLRPEDHQQPYGTYGGDPRPGSAEGTFRSFTLHLLAICAARDQRVDPQMETQRLADFHKETCPKQRAVDGTRRDGRGAQDSLGVGEGTRAARGQQPLRRACEPRRPRAGLVRRRGDGLVTTSC